MNIGMAVRTGYGFRRPRAHSVNRVGSYAAVALVAERVDGRHVQQAGVLGTVRSVASQTPLGLDRDVFIDERPAHLGVALGADRWLRSLQQLFFLALMNAVAADTVRSRFCTSTMPSPRSHPASFSITEFTPLTGRRPGRRSPARTMTSSATTIRTTQAQRPLMARSSTSIIAA